VYQDASLRVDVSRCPRTYSGRRPCRQDGRCAPSAFPRTATDGPCERRSRARSAVWQPGGSRVFPGRGRPGRRVRFWLG
jgi:hypothetical protein